MKKVLGAISILMGTAILVWFAWNLVTPRPEFEWSFLSVFQLLLPVAMVCMGWRWLRGTTRGS